MRWKSGERSPCSVRSTQALVRKSQTAHELRESWIGAQFLPAWIEAQPYQPVSSLIEGFIEPGEGGILLTKPRMDEGDAIRRYKFPACQSSQFEQGVLGFIGAASDSSDKSPCGNRDRPFGEPFFNVLKFGERVVKPSKLLVGSAQP